jgi:hypothetical protein
MHPKHERIVRELLAASGKENSAFQEVARKWKFSHFKIGSDNCHLCHTRIRHGIVVKHENGVYLIIGRDCYDYVAAGNIMAVHKEHIARIKEYAKKNIDTSYLAWLGAQENLPQEIRETLAVISELGHPPSIEAAMELVDYYKGHRRFSISSLLTPDEQKTLMLMLHQKMMPRTITLNQLPRVKKLLAKIKTSRDRMFIKAEAYLDDCLENGNPISFSGAYIVVHEELINKISCLRIEIFINPNVHIILPGNRIKKALNLKRWSETYTGLMQSTMPEKARIRRQGYEIWLYESDLRPWIEQARKLQVTLMREENEKKRQRASSPPSADLSKPPSPPSTSFNPPRLRTE